MAMRSFGLFYFWFPFLLKFAGLCRQHNLEEQRNEREIEFGGRSHLRNGGNKGRGDIYTVTSAGGDIYTVTAADRGDIYTVTSADRGDIYTVTSLGGGDIYTNIT